MRDFIAKLDFDYTRAVVLRECNKINIETAANEKFLRDISSGYAIFFEVSGELVGAFRNMAQKSVACSLMQIINRHGRISAL